LALLLVTQSSNGHGDIIGPFLLRATIVMGIQ
jgi:hypothetical protein